GETAFVIFLDAAIGNVTSDYYLEHFATAIDCIILSSRDTLAHFPDSHRSMGLRQLCVAVHCACCFPSGWSAQVGMGGTCLDRVLPDPAVASAAATSPRTNDRSRISSARGHLLCCAGGSYAVGQSAQRVPVAAICARYCSLELYWSAGQGHLPLATLGLPYLRRDSIQPVFRDDH